MMNRKKQIQIEKKSKDNDLKKLARLSEKKVMINYQTGPNGLSEEMASKRLAEYGPNEVATQRPTPWFILLIEAFKDPFVYVLALLMVVSALTNDFEASLVMGVMILLSVGIRFIQEYRSQKASLALKELIETTCGITRDGVTTEIPIDEVVPGDIVNLSTGDMIPADARFIWTKDLFVNQASLTGESMPVEKLVQVEEPTAEDTALDLANLAFMGTDVLSGQGRAIILKTGNDTFFGDIASNVSEKRGETSFDRGVKNVSKVLIRFMIIMVPIVFLLNGLTKGDWGQAFFFAIAVAVGLTPEMLPMIITSNLAKGAIKMSKKKVIVKELNAIQNLGAMDILCTDKTGTITEDHVVLVKHVSPIGDNCKKVLDLAFLNSNYQTGWKNLMDHAVINYYEENNLAQKIGHVEKIDEIPFDFSRRRLTVAVNNEGHQLMITKGAVEEMMKICSHVEINDEVIPLTDSLREKMLTVSVDMNQDGMRVLGVAYKKEVHDTAIYSIADENEMILAGFMGFLDPAKKSSITAIKSLHEHGVTVKVLTGDNEIVSQKVCKDVGIEVGQVLLGNEIETMSDEALMEASEKVNLFAKLNPMQKARIIALLQKKGHTVGFMGDGINDAPALRKADVGISVDTAADITKEASSIILLEKSLTVLEDGVLEGRTVFGNMMKYIKMTVSSNFGNVFSVLVASAFLPFLPMLSIQLLVQNLIYDVAQLTIPWDRMDEEDLMKPAKWNTGNLMKFTLSIGPISSIFDILTFLLMYFVFHANTIGNQALFHSGWFVIGLITQTVVVHIIRTKKIPFIQSMASIPVTISTICVIVIAILIPDTALGGFFNFVALPTAYWKWMVLIVLAYGIAVQLVKTIYIKINKEWL
ncbi:magnesium-translocating P-type ATPase [Carnobacterium divergens]|uniref:Magnesium-transporting ATPase, P-type 1 n=2 Tax=Carnobacterium divergens TaxID=2748 RepID=A0A5F0MDN8_CARDV|nr:magnesium-translocating P-type ATPase [Carnobacterium divergens]TFI71685.1 magnesium-translocating P-type ATPase [Carnobacterium divergens]TFI76327.1 magnesium-translocating P-type ATPase [Carnobacterium divergens]TFI82200.1 magnesium-translocating P-type ATPase [Carnobacterium divergens]TFI94508.1 magnesium-translocating P-type ATPase [Carnobacterium divergens]